MENLKKWGLIALVIVAALAVFWGYFKPARVIETKKEVKVEVTDKETVKKLTAQISSLTTQKTEVEKKLAKASELNKNVNIHREFYPDGKIKSEDIVDLSKYVKKSDSAEVATTTVTVTVAGKVVEDKKEKEKTKITDTLEEKKDTKYMNSVGIGPAFTPDFRKFGAGVALRIGPNFEITGALTQKDFFKETDFTIMPLFFVF